MIRTSVKTTPETLNDNIRTPLEMPDGHQCFGINELMVSAISALRAGSGFGDGHGLRPWQRVAATAR